MLTLSVQDATGYTPTTTIEAALPAGALVLSIQLATDSMCFSRPDLHELIRQECDSATKKAAEWKTCTEVRDAAQTDAIACRSFLQAREVDVANLTLKNDELKRAEAKRWPAWVWYGLGALTVGAAVTGAAFVFR